MARTVVTLAFICIASLSLAVLTLPFDKGAPRLASAARQQISSQCQPASTRRTLLDAVRQSSTDGTCIPAGQFSADLSTRMDTEVEQGRLSRTEANVGTTALFQLVPDRDVTGQLYKCPTTEAMAQIDRIMTMLRRRSTVQPTCQNYLNAAPASQPCEQMTFTLENDCTSRSIYLKMSTGNGTFQKMGRVDPRSRLSVTGCRGFVYLVMNQGICIDAIQATVNGQTFFNNDYYFMT